MPTTRRGRRFSVDLVVRHREILQVLLAAPGRPLTIRRLAGLAHTPYATTWRVVQDLLAVGALEGEEVGPSFVVSVNRVSPFLADLERIVSVEPSPHRHAARRFAELASRVHAVRKAILFGSVSRREETMGSDVDVAVVLDRRTAAALKELDRLSVQVHDETGLVVVPVTVTARELARGGSFPRTLEAGETLYERP